MRISGFEPNTVDGELVELRVGDAVHIEPMGILQPKAGMGEAAIRLGEFLRKATAGRVRSVKPRENESAKLLGHEQRTDARMMQGRRIRNSGSVRPCLLG